jgi:hypothetical protein
MVYIIQGEGVMCKFEKCLKFHVVSIALLAVGLLTGCNKPWVNLRMEPVYICTGESLTIHWNVGNIDLLMLMDNKGTPLYFAPSGRGKFTTPLIEPDMIPLWGQGWQGGDTRKYPIFHRLVHDPTWTDGIKTDVEDSSPPEYVLSHVLAEDSKLRKVFDDTFREKYERYYENRKEYKALILKTYHGFRWDLSGRSVFGSKAVATKVKNASKRYLLITGPNFTETRMAPGQVIDVNYIRPAGIWIGKYEEPETRLIGVQDLERRNSYLPILKSRRVGVLEFELTCKE